MWKARPSLKYPVDVRPCSKSLASIEDDIAVVALAILLEFRDVCLVKKYF